MDKLRVIRVLAAASVKARDMDYFIRHARRWFSDKLKTPYREVEAIPDEEVLQHFFEARYETMDEDDFDEEVERLCETEAETAAREASEENEKSKDDDWYQQVLREEKERLAKKKPAARETSFSDKDGPIATQPAYVMGSSLPTTFNDEPLRPKAEDIKLEFVDEKEFEDLISDDWALLAKPKK